MSFAISLRTEGSVLEQAVAALWTSCNKANLCCMVHSGPSGRKGTPERGRERLRKEMRWITSPWDAAHLSPFLPHPSCSRGTMPAVLLQRTLPLPPPYEDCHSLSTGLSLDHHLEKSSLRGSCSFHILHLPGKVHVLCRCFLHVYNISFREGCTSNLFCFCVLKLGLILFQSKLCPIKEKNIKNIANRLTQRCGAAIPRWLCICSHYQYTHLRNHVAIDTV